MTRIHNHCLILAGMIVAFGTTPACAQGVIDEVPAEIPAGDVTLGVTYYRPADVDGDLPLIVTGHGSAPSTRDDVFFYTANALNLGFAVVSFDKRGTGESTGEYVRFSVAGSLAQFDDLANDMVHTVEWAAEQPGVDGSCVGLFGGSQAGWIMPLAASRQPLVDFIIVGEGAVATAGQEETHGQTIQLLRGSESSPDITAADIAAADAALEAYDGPHGYDPIPLLAELDVPVLWIFGLQDAVIPVMPSLTRLQNLIAAGHDNHHVLVFPFGDHNFTNRATGDRYDLEGPIANWLEDTGVCD